MIIKRQILSHIERHLAEPEITVLVGARQVGKTTLLRHIEEKLRQKGEKTIFFNLDVEADMEFFSSQQKLINKLRFEFGSQKAYVFIDEIQRKPDAGLFLKGLYDLRLPYKFVVSGSGSLDLKAKVHESLAGRKRLFVLHPVSLLEFIDYRTDYKYSDRLTDFLKINQTEAENLLIEYLNFGGYPKVILLETLEEKMQYLTELFDAYFIKDLEYFLGYKAQHLYPEMFRYLAHHQGKILNYNKLAQHLNLSIYKTKQLIWYARQTFVISLLPPYHRNFAKELKLSPVVYFEDLGLANFSKGQLGKLFSHQDLAFQFQNLVHNLLIDYCKKHNYTLHYWRTSDGSEIDFVIDKFTDVVPVEIKFRQMSRPSLTKAFHSFIRRYKPSTGYLINFNLAAEIRINSTTVKLLPWYEIFGGVI